jgi:uncharacterized protein (DUF305 family)
MAAKIAFRYPAGVSGTVADMKPTRSRTAAVLASFVTALFISACGGPSSDAHSGHGQDPTTPLITEQPAGYNADDIAFATNMIPHHQQAVEMSGLVPDHSTDPAVIDLASAITAAQKPEIDTLKVFLVQWKENPDSDTGQGGHGGMAMDGMIDDATMARLDGLHGTDFDTLWLQSMIGHHRGAIEMAKAELANGENVDAKQMAQNIVTTQQAEIDQMQKMLGGG